MCRKCGDPEARHGGDAVMLDDIDIPYTGPVPEVGYTKTARHWPIWVFYGGPAYARDLHPGRITLPWRVWPVVDIQGDNYGDGLIVRILGTGAVDGGGIDAVVDDWDLDPIGYVVEPDEPTMPCGCTEYHTADCPLVTDRYEPQTDFGPYTDDDDDW